MGAAATGHDMTKLEIEIVGGLHKGAKLSLDLGDYTIGSTPDADIVIRDPGVGDEHAVLRIDRWSVHIEAVGGDVSVGQKLIAKGHGSRVRMPATIAMGDAALALQRNDGAGIVPPALKPISDAIASRPLLVAAGVVICALALSVASRGFPSSTPPNPTPHAYDPVGVSDAMVKEAAVKLKEKFVSSGMTAVKVTAAEKHVVVAGTVAKRDSSVVTNAERWFDETYGGRIVLTMNLEVSEKAPAFRLQAIWYGERPYVILEDGRHIYEGSTMDNGWRIQRIANDRIVINKDGESLELTYQ